MPDGVKRNLVAVALLAVLILLLVLLVPGERKGEPRQERRPADPSAHVAPPALPRAAAQPPPDTSEILPSPRVQERPSRPVDASAPKGMLRLRARNSLDGSSWPSLAFRCTHDGEMEVARTDGDGLILLPPAGSWTLSSEDPAVRLLLPDKSFRPEDGDQDVWLYRFKRIHGRVTLERPEKATPDGVLVAARPTNRSSASSGKAPLGTAEWCEELTRGQRLPWQVRAAEGLYEIDIPLLQEMVIVASARGHIAETKSLALGAPNISEKEINFYLRAGESIRVTIKDPDGNAIGGVPVQFVSTFKVPTSELNIEELRLRKRASNVGFGTVGNDATGLTTVSFEASAHTDKFGAVSLSQMASEGKLVLMIHESGYEPFVAVLETAGEFASRDIAMKRIVPVRDGYRLSWKGKFVSEGATLQLCEMVEDLTLALRPIKAGKEGVFPASQIPPGRRYYAIVFDPKGIGTRNGPIQFGSDETVDISDFE